MSKIPSTTDDSVLRVVRNQTVYIEWEIHKFFDKMDVRRFESPTFSLSDSEWSISFYRNYNHDVYLTLLKKDSPTDVRVSVAIGIKKGKDSEFKSVYTNRLFEKKGYQWQALGFPTSELLQCKDVVAPNGVLTIFLMVCNLDGSSEDVAVEADCQIPSDGLETLSKDFKELFISRNKGDVSFKVKDREFLAHKLVLSTRSTVFQAMFETDMVEKNDGTVDILDSDPDTFEQFLVYLYSGDLNVASSNNAFGLYLLADKYNLKKLKETCSEILSRAITADSFCDISLLAYLHDETKLLETATDFFINHANLILPTPKWATFIVEQFTFANELLIKMANKFLKS